MLIGQNGEQQTVLRIEQEFVSGFLVHNLTIRKDHTFAVGPDAILVHNTGGCGGLSPDDSARLAGLGKRNKELRAQRELLQDQLDDLKGSVPGDAVEGMGGFDNYKAERIQRLKKGTFNLFEFK